MEHFGYYILCILAVVIGFLVVKKIASCLIKSILLFVIIGILVAVYYYCCR
jgi:hypothetical protein